MRLLTINLLIFFFLVDTSFAAGYSAVVERYIEAFNNQDIESMLEDTADNIQWMSVSGEKVSVESTGQDQLRKSMLEYFSSVPAARSKIRSINSSGPFVYTLEQAYWSSNGMEKSQCSMAVYQIIESKILNVWYFPAHECQ